MEVGGALLAIEDSSATFYTLIDTKQIDFFFLSFFLFFVVLFVFF